MPMSVFFVSAIVVFDLPSHALQLARIEMRDEEVISKDEEGE